MTLALRHHRAAPAESPCTVAAPGEAGGERRDMCAKSELEATDSDYLCPFCHDPLYVKDGTADEACFDRTCPAYIDREEISMDVHGQELMRRTSEQCDKSIRRFHKFGHAFLLRRLFEARVYERTQIFQGGDASVNMMASVDYLLAGLARNAAWGHLEDVLSYLRTFQQYRKDFDMLQFVEMSCSKYYVTTANGDLYVIKYHSALEKFHSTLGIFGSGNRRDRTGRYSFDFIDNTTRKKPIKHPFDFDAIYNSTPTIANQLNHAFKMGSIVSYIYRYPARSEDFAALYSVWTRCLPGPGDFIFADDLRKVYDGATKKNKMQGDFDQFLADYTSGHKYAPILIFDGEKYHFEYHDLLLYLLYLFLTNKTLSGTQTKTGQRAYNDMRMVAASAFEEEIRQKLRNDGFKVLPAPGQGQLHIPSKKDGKEFDCVAVDREKKIIVLVEAKYEDIAPSSKAGTTLVDQLVLDRRRGLLGHAKTHHERRRLFKRHFARLKNVGLDLAGSFHDYVVHTAIVTKHEPVISRYMDVDIISYERFASIDFRMHVGPLSCPAPSHDPSHAPTAPPNAAPPQGGPDGKEPAAGGAGKDLPLPDNPKDRIASRARRGPEQGRRSRR